MIVAITSDLIGRIGGGGGTEVHQIPVNFVSSSGNGMYHVANVPVPEGKQARVIVLVYSTSSTGVSATAVPHLYIGGNFITGYRDDYRLGATSIVTGPVAVEVERRNTGGQYDPSFVGEIFWWEVEE